MFIQMVVNHWLTNMTIDDDQSCCVQVNSWGTQQPQSIHSSLVYPQFPRDTSEPSRQLVVDDWFRDTTMDTSRQAAGKDVNQNRWESIAWFIGINGNRDPWDQWESISRK